MTVYKPIVMIGGALQQLASSDSLDAAVAAGTSALATPVAFATSITLDVAAHDVWEVDALTADTQISFTNPAAGRRGVIWVTQDATGGRRLGFASPAGWTVNDNVSGAAPPPPASSPSAITRYAYALYAVGGANFIDIDRTTPTATVRLVTSGASQVVSGGDRMVI